MIELAPHTAVMIYLGLTLISIIFLWLKNHFRAQKKALVISKEKLITCEYCSQVYLADIEKIISRCPICHSFNQF